ncbi:MAG: sugar phosphate isomerase/epimerase family protein [Salinibacter sp.]
MTSRRDFFKTAGAGAAGGLLGAGTSGSFAADGSAPDNGWARGSKLGISSYSYWHFDGEPVPIRHVIDEASAIGVGGVDVLHRQMPREDPEYARELRRYAFERGVDLICLSIHQDFVTPDERQRQHHVNHTKYALELASQMGIPCIRVNSGRWGTIDSFDTLMAKGGNEPPLEGYAEDDAYRWCIDAFEQCVPVAREKGVVMALENHWGLTSSAEGVLRIVQEVDSPWLKVLADTGNFPDRTYDQLEALASETILVSAKTYYGGGEWYSLDLDYNRIAGIFRDADFRGYVTLEFEGTAEPAASVRKSLTRLSEAFRA